MEKKTTNNAKTNTTKQSVEAGGSNPSLSIPQHILFDESLDVEVRSLLSVVQDKHLSKNKLVALRLGISHIINSRFADRKKFYVPIDEKTFASINELNSWLDNINNPLYKLLFKLLAWTGVRPCEMFRVSFKDFDFKNEDLYVRVSKNFNNFVKVPLPSKLCLEIKTLFGYGLNKDAPFKQCSNEYRQVFRKNCSKLGGKFVKTYADSLTNRPLFFFRPYSFRYLYQSLIANQSDLIGRALHNTPSVACKHYLTKIERIRAIVNKLY